MSGTALFLGAGASKAFGLPITSELFPLILQKLSEGSLFQGKNEAEDKLQEYIKTLYPGLDSLPAKEYPLITDTLSLLDHLLNTGNSLGPGFKTKDIVAARNLFEMAILEVLKIPFRNRPGQRSQETPVLLKQFGSWIVENHNQRFVSVISTNYDIAIETEIYSRINDINRDIDFGINWRDPDPFREIMHLRPEAARIGIYKLHGSANWLRCNLCNHIYINLFYDITHHAFQNEIDVSNSCHCGHAPLSTLIVAPSLARVIYDNNLPHIWNNAFEALRTATEWVIIGYSFPPEDLNIKSMLLRAFNARNTKPRITIVQKGMDSEARYRSIFGDVEFISGGLEEFMDRETREGSLN